MEQFRVLVRSADPGGGVDRRGPVRALGLALAVVLLAALLVPLAGSAQDAAEDEPVATDEAALAPPDGSEETDPDAAIRGGGDAGVEVTSEAGNAPDPVDPWTSGIALSMWECSSDHGGDLQRLTESCWAADHINFEVYGGGVLNQRSQGQISVTGLPSGRYTIHEYLPQDYAQLIAFCGFYPSYEVNELASVVVYDGYYEFTLDYDESIGCMWFHVLSDQEDSGGSLTIYKWLCPEGYDLYAQDADSAEECDAPYDGVKFTLASTDDYPYDYYDEQNSGDTIPGGVRWEGLSARDYGIEETIPEGIAAAFVLGPGCEGFTFPSLVVTLEEGQHLVCDWYNIPEPEDNGAVFIYKYFCPEVAPIDYYTDEREEFGDSPDGICPLYEGDAVGFDLTSQASGETETRFTDPNDGYGASWDQVPAGDVTVTEHAQDGYGPPRVFCGVSHDTAFDYFPVEVEGWSIDFAIPSGKTVICFWYNIPDQDDGELMIYKSFCQAGVDYSLVRADLESLQEYCENYYGDEVVFDLYNAASGTTETRTTGTGYAGTAAWYPIPGGDVTVTEHAWEGYDRAVVLCAVLSLENDEYEFFDVQVEDLTASFAFPSGEPVRCWWFNIPTEDALGEVTIVAYRCEGKKSAKLNCARSSGGETFELSPVAGGAAVTLTTGQTGKDTATVPEGEWELAQVGADWCRVRSSDLNAAGNVVVDAGRESVVRVYNCGGSGLVSGGGVIGNGETAGSLMVAGMSGGAGTLGLRLAAGQGLVLESMSARRLRRPHPEEANAA